ncbi:hypothetical protein GIB67_005057 [Kingdonia uniflora]|uniref:CSC1-like protein n=1 Tax=Kingdonia uniflora TaxID=39325 RepID=A0A7J7PBY7_9MAGN|nr:hypothetical protein GIB67_005057 [Kingdonia uniflora]
MTPHEYSGLSGYRSSIRGSIPLARRAREDGLCMPKGTYLSPYPRLLPDSLHTKRYLHLQKYFLLPIAFSETVPVGLAPCGGVLVFLTYPACGLARFSRVPWISQVVYNANSLTKMVEKKKGLQNRLNYYQNKFDRNSDKRPTTKTGLWGLWGKHVDAIDYYTDEIEKLCKEEASERQMVVEDPKAIMPAAFISFRTRWGAAVCAQTQQSSNPTTWLTEWAPEPRDVYWANLAIPFFELTIRRLIMAVSTFFLTFFFMIPIALVQSLANIDGIEKVMPFLKPIIEKQVFVNRLAPLEQTLTVVNPILTDILKRWKVVKSVIQGFLPGIALKIFLILLPTILMTMSKIEGYTSLSLLERRSAGKYYLFILVNVFLGSIITGTAFQQLHNFIHQAANEIPKTIGVSIPMKATFFITYIMVDGWAGIAGEILRLVPLVMFHLKNQLLVKTVQDREHAMDPGSLDFSSSEPRIQLYFLLGFVYSVVTPILLPFIVIFFGFSYLVFRHQVCYISHIVYYICLKLILYELGVLRNLIICGMWIMWSGVIKGIDSDLAILVEGELRDEESRKVYEALNGSIREAVIPLEWTIGSFRLAMAPGREKETNATKKLITVESLAELSDQFQQLVTTFSARALHPSPQPTPLGAMTKLPLIFESTDTKSVKSTARNGSGFERGSGDRYSFGNVDDVGFIVHLGGRRGVPPWERHRALTKQTHDLHLKVPEFYGKLDADTFIDWLDKDEKIFIYKRYGDPKQVAIVESRFFGYALMWWNNVQQYRRSQGYLIITEWSKKRRDMIERFIPMNCDEIIFWKLQSLMMGLSTIDDYTDQFYFLEFRARLRGTEQQRVSRHKKCNCLAFAKKVGLVVDVMRENVIATVL